MTKIRHLLFFLVLASCFALSNLIGKNYFYDHPYLLAFPSIMHSIALFGISYVDITSTSRYRIYNRM